MLKKLDNYKDILLVIAFIACVSLALFSVNNHLGHLVPKDSIDSHGYVFHDYYTGFTTEMPFKLAITAINFILFVFIANRFIAGPFKILKAVVLLSVILIIAWFISFNLFFEF